MDIQPGRDVDTGYDTLIRWVVLEGNRLLITAGITVAFFALAWALVAAGELSVGPRSPIQSILGSGVVAGLFSLISVTLAINQLISSRVFGTLDRLQEKHEGGTELRESVGDIADHPSPPIRIASFISFIGGIVAEQADRLPDEYARRDEAVADEIETYADNVDEYAGIVQEVSSEMPPEKVISTLAGPDFAHHFDRTDELLTERYEHLTADERDALETIAELLGAVTVFRQYFKTVALHQELAQLSRQFIVVGFPALVAALLVPLAYETNPPTVLTSAPLEPVVCATLALVAAPLVLVMVYVLRIATIFRYTVTVAPFVPPVEWPWSEEPD
ncbi:hypothetical protein [Halopiger goleimassiliensis]|uniref:hypothetical protein n=1 Tax=Halopiger goleimassiliensis TaxID=1293048 RepID=UPI00067819EE|nr:hypothetical protein [Halopiger goleimassiliensis]